MYEGINFGFGTNSFSFNAKKLDRLPAIATLFSLSVFLIAFLANPTDSDRNFIVSFSQLKLFKTCLLVAKVLAVIISHPA